jgi:chitodextrinase
MARTLPCRPVAASLAAALLIVLAPAAAYAADRTPPPAPKNLRVVGFTSFSVSLAWDPVRAKDLASYIVRNSGVAATFVPKTETTFTWTLNLRPGQTCGFHVAATDTSGNWSTGSNQVTVTLPADTIAPTQPIVTVTEIGSTHVSLSWEVEENGPYIFSSVYQDGVLVMQEIEGTQAIVPRLDPETTYTFAVKVRDWGINWSPPSDPVTATTISRAIDVTAPTAPDVGGDAVASDGETWLFWHASTDDLTPQSLLIYEIRLNGAVDHHILGDTRTILYGVPGAINTYEVIAIDESGNRSEAGTLVLDLRF